MLRDYFSAAMTFLLRPDIEGGPYHDTPHDPGSSTTLGCTYATWFAWCKLHSETTSLDAFKVLTQQQLEPLYRAQYWNACRCGSMSAVGVMVFDSAVNSGPANAARFLQTVLGTKVDGQIGPNTIAAFANHDQAALTRALCAQREDYYRHCANVAYFGNGWNRRAEACRDYVLSLIQQCADENHADAQTALQATQSTLIPRK